MQPCLNCVSSFEKVLLWEITRDSYQFFYFLLRMSFCISRTSFNIIWKRFLTDSPKPPTPFAKRDKSFLPIFLQMPSEVCLIFTYLLTKPCKSIFCVSAVNCYCTNVFKGSNYRFSGVLSRTHFKNSYFNTSISNYL